MPVHSILVEFAVAFDLVLDMDAPTFSDALEDAGVLAMDVAIRHAIERQFPDEVKPRVVRHTTEITDVRRYKGES